MKNNQLEKKALTAYIDAFSGVEIMATHLVAHAMLKLGFEDSTGLARPISSIPVCKEKEALLQACLFIIDKEGILQWNSHVQGYTIDKSAVKSMKELAELKASLIDNCPSIDSHLNLLLQCARSLPAVIAGKLDGLQVLFPDGQSELVARTYQGNALQDDLNLTIGKQVVDELRRIETSRYFMPRVLEIGAGTCATSLPVMKALEQSDIKAELCVSDISLSLVKEAEKRFSAQYPFTRFSVVDIENQNEDVIKKNGLFDVIYAANVLHATSDITPVIDNIVKLLRPGGVVIINELTDFSIFATVTFGLTDGWWLFKDDERISFSPLIKAQKWKQLLSDAGFKNIFAYYPSYNNESYTYQAMISGHLNDG